MSLAHRLKAWRHALGLTQEQFAQRCGLPKRTVIGYENGEREPGSAALAAIARTGVNLNWLLTGEGEMLPKETPGIELKGAERHARRWQKIIELVESIEDEEERSALLEEIFARAKTAAELAKLRRQIDEIKKKQTGSL
jgi:transcriptional regulator with XRE-family HTH domain